MHKMTKETNISPIERKAVYDRDNRCCVICGKRDWIEVAHYISRARQGKGIRQNLVCLCKTHHQAYDGTQHDKYEPDIKKYLEGWYGELDPKTLIYDKWEWTNDK